VADARQREIDRRAIGRTSRYRLRARSAVEGYYSGIHKSPFHGFNVEFAEYREYSEGDDLRYMDWRMFARSDRFFVKQFETETNLNCYLLVDSSASMDFGRRDGTRFDYAASLAAALTLVMLRQGDQVGLVTFDTAVRRFIPPRGNARHFGTIVEALECAKPGEDTNISSVLHEIAERVRRRSMIIVISDLFDDVDLLMNGLQHFRHRRHEVIVLHLLDDAEIDFPFDRVMLFEGMERGEQVVADPVIVGQAYRARFREYLENVRRGCAQKNIDYERMRLSVPFDRALTNLLARRS